MATIEAPIKATPNDPKIAARYDPITGMVSSVLAPSIRTIVMRKFLEFFSELFLIAAMPPKTRSIGAINGTDTKADAIAKMTASALAAAEISFIFPSLYYCYNQGRNE